MKEEDIVGYCIIYYKSIKYDMWDMFTTLEDIDKETNNIETFNKTDYDTRRNRKI